MSLISAPPDYFDQRQFHEPETFDQWDEAFAGSTGINGATFEQPSIDEAHIVSLHRAIADVLDCAGAECVALVATHGHELLALLARLNGKPDPMVVASDTLYAMTGHRLVIKRTQSAVRGVLNNAGYSVSDGRRNGSSYPTLESLIAAEGSVL